MLRISFKGFECASNASNHFRMVRSLHLNASNPLQVVRIRIRMLRIPFEWLEFAFECFESLSNSLKFHSNASNPFQVVQTSI